MSIHPSLKNVTKNKQQRTVLKRIERVKKLIDEQKWEEEKIFNLPKIKITKLKIKKEKAVEAEATAAGTAVPGTTPAAATAKPGAKPGVPAEKSKPKAEDKKSK